jgi:hypothetical protein
MELEASCLPMVATNGNLIFMKVLFPIALTLPAASLTTNGKLNSISSTLSTVNIMDPLFLVSDAVVFTGKLYDQAFVQSCKNGSSAGAFTHGEFNGKEIACWIIPRYMKNGKWSNSTMWKVNGKRVAQKKLIEAVCKEK